MNTPTNVGRKSRMVFHGTPLTPGIARGKAYLLKRVDLQQLRKNNQTVDLVPVELARLDFAVRTSSDQISRFMKSDRNTREDISYSIFETSLTLLKDTSFISPIKEAIERTSLRGESILAAEISRLRDTALESADELSAKNLITMQDLYYRVLYNMLPNGEDRMSLIRKIPAGSILIADRLTPVEVAVVPVGTVVGILIEETTRQSHASIMARTLGVPVIINFPGIGSLVEESTDLLIDAYRGLVFLNPSETVVKECADVETRHHKAVNPVVHPGDTSLVHSADGSPIRLLCNASTLADILLAHTMGIREIGLFRSELRYLANTVQPSKENEAAYYSGILGVEGIAGITVRLLDMGGDKLPLYMQMAQETDPQLGCRGIRFLLSRPDLMKTQVRAILAARGTCNVQILLPFITTVDDLLKAREIIDAVFKDMNIPGDPPQTGIMIEVPSVALSIDHFLPRVDFVSLGTNDLIQYFFAVNRDQDDLQGYNRFTHPAFLKMLCYVIAVCERHGKPLTACGEMASDPVGAALLMAAGAGNLSIQPDAVHHVRHALSKLDAGALRTLMPALLNLDSADEVEQKLSVQK